MPGFIPGSPERLNLASFSGLGLRAAQMANLTADLLATVAAMSALYYEDEDEDGNPVDMNALQPDSFPAAIAGSLDEWTFQIVAARDDWRAIAEHNAQQEKDAQRAKDAPFLAAGFVYEFPGYWVRELPNGASVAVSDADGSGSPTASNWMAAVYAPGENERGEGPVMDLRSTDERQALTYDQALAACLAAAATFPAPVATDKA
jgi:hypothetical protein